MVSHILVALFDGVHLSRGKYNDNLSWKQIIIIA